jgi:hypothetical protein
MGAATTHSRSKAIPKDTQFCLSARPKPQSGQASVLVTACAFLTIGNENVSNLSEPPGSRYQKAAAANSRIKVRNSHAMVDTTGRGLDWFGLMKLGDRIRGYKALLWGESAPEKISYLSYCLEKEYRALSFMGKPEARCPLMNQPISRGEDRSRLHISPDSRPGLFSECELRSSEKCPFRFSREGGNPVFLDSGSRSLK